MSSHKFGFEPVAEVLYYISMEGGHDESSGRSESPTGWFARFSIEAFELDDIQEDFERAIKEAELKDVKDLVGHWLISENEQGFVGLSSFDSKEALMKCYNELEAKYNEWESQDETV